VKNVIKAAILAIVVGFVFMDKPFVLLVFSTIAIMSIAALGLNILSGYAGVVSIGHAAFMLIGAYTSAMMSIHLHTPFAVNVITGAILSAIFSLVFGVPALRLAGFYLAIATLAMMEALVQFTYASEFLGAAQGIKNIPRLFQSELAVYALNAAALIGISYLINLMIKSPVGVKFKMLRDSEMASSAYGVNVSVTKIQAFVVSAVLCSIAGSLYAHTIGYIGPEDFGLFPSVMLLAMILIGGMATVSGGVIGAAIITGLPFFFSRGKIPMSLIVGVALIFFVLFSPAGLVYRISVIYGKYLQRPYIWLIRVILKMLKPTGKFVTVNGVKMHYVEHGEGQPVIMIHGNLAHHKWYQKVWDLQGYKTYAIDLPNHMWSEWTESVSIEKYADFVKGFMAELGISKAIIVGHSLGGAVAMNLAVKYPDAVDKLVLLAAGPPTGIQSAPERYPVYERLKTDKNMLKMFMKAVAPGLKDMLLMDKLVNYVFLQNPMVYIAHADEVGKFNITNIKSQYKNPYIFLLGDKDIAISKNMAEATLAYLGSNGKLIMHEGIGHALIMENPELFKKEFYAFANQSI